MERRGGGSVVVVWKRGGGGVFERKVEVESCVSKDVSR